MYRKGCLQRCELSLRAHLGGNTNWRGCDSEQHGQARSAKVRQGLFTAVSHLQRWLPGGNTKSLGLVRIGPARRGLVWQGLFTAGSIWQRVLFGGNTIWLARHWLGKAWMAKDRTGRARAVYSGMVSYKKSFRWQHHLDRHGSAGQVTDRSGSARAVNSVMTFP